MDDIEIEQLKYRYQSLQDLIILTSHEWRHNLSRLQVNLDMLSTSRQVIDYPNWERISDEMHTDIAMMRRIADSYLATVALQYEPYIHPQTMRLVADIIDPVLHRFGGLLGLKQQAVQIELDPAELCVWGDSLLLTILFDNLLVNAIHYSPEVGQIKITGSLRSNLVHLSVWNSGTGLKPELAQKMFEPFARGKTQTGHEGAGVGLYLVRRIVEVHGGEIWIDTAEGTGTRFLFDLPASDETSD